MENNTHTLELWTEFYNDVESGLKPFELRYNDRDYKVGDYLNLLEYDNNKGEFTGKQCTKKVTYMLLGGAFGLDKGCVIMGLENNNYQALKEENESLTTQLAKANSDKERLGASLKLHLDTVNTDINIMRNSIFDKDDVVLEQAEIYASRITKILQDCGITL